MRGRVACPAATAWPRAPCATACRGAAFGGSPMPWTAQALCDPAAGCSRIGDMLGSDRCAARHIATMCLGVVRHDAGSIDQTLARADHALRAVRRRLAGCPAVVGFPLMHGGTRASPCGRRRWRFVAVESPRSWGRVPARCAWRRIRAVVADALVFLNVTTGSVVPATATRGLTDWRKWMSAITYAVSFAIAGVAGMSGAPRPAELRYDASALEQGG